MAKSINQKGFGLIEVLLLIIAVSVICGVGFYIFNVNREQNDLKNNSQATQAEVSSPDSKPSYLEIQELGVKLKLNDKIKNVSYKLDDMSTADFKLFNFFDTELTKQVNNCRKSGERFENYKVSQVFRGKGKFTPDTSSGNTNILLKQFEDSYIAVIGQPNFSPCVDSEGISVDNASITDSVESLRKDLVDAFSSAEKM